MNRWVREVLESVKKVVDDGSWSSISLLLFLKVGVVQFVVASKTTDEFVGLPCCHHLMMRNLFGD